MNPEAERIFQAATQLNAEDRMDLIEALLDITPQEEPPILHESWRAEIARRAAEIDSGKVQGIPWSEVLRRAREATRGKD
jgi:putative addiction module component (TIGR02574 family)